MFRGVLPLSKRSLGTTIIYLVCFGGLRLCLSVLIISDIAGRLAVSGEQ